MLFVGSNVFAAQTKVNLCHKTSLRTNSFVNISVGESAAAAKLAKGDFAYGGPVNARGLATREGRQWCKDNSHLAPTPTPTASPSPAVKKNVKVNICHKTLSKRVPYTAIRVNLNAFDGEGRTDHTHHGDFQYWGPVNRFGNPTREGKAWCKAQVTLSPTPTPTSTPTN